MIDWILRKLTQIHNLPEAVNDTSPLVLYLMCPLFWEAVKNSYS